MMRRRRLAGRALLVIILLPLLLAAGDVLTYRPRPWLDAYGRLKHDLAQGYANLDWLVEHRGMDLPALDQRTTAALAGAHSRILAAVAIRDFIRSFHDPHLRLVLGRPPGHQAALAPANGAADRPPSTAEPADPPAGESCKAAGYREDEHGFGFPVANDPRWKPVRAGDFPAGILNRTGVLRIAQLGEDRYASACEAVFREGMGQRQLQLAVRARLQAELQDRLAELRRQGARLLLIDLSGNGGGTEWVEEVVSLLSDRVLFRQAARRVAPACARDTVWAGYAPPCPVFGAAADSGASVVGKGAWRGMVVALVDGRTASAAEDLVVWLQQNGVARVAGERTAGAGCGYVDGGNPSYLGVAPLTVHMPNCARFLADGTNEIEGIEPDLPLPMSGSTGRSLAAALAAMLANW